MVDYVETHEAFCFDSFPDKLLFFDDFLGDQIQDEWRESGGVGGDADVVDGQTGGIMRITTDSDDDDSWQVDWNNIGTIMASSRCTIEIRALITNLTCRVFLALHDGTADFVTFKYDSDVDGDWDFQVRNAGSASGYIDTGVTADTSYHIYRIECHTHGTAHVHFYVDGTETSNSPYTTAADVPTLEMQPWIYLQAREAVAKTLDVDYVYVRQDR